MGGLDGSQQRFDVHARAVQLVDSRIRQADRRFLLRIDRMYMYLPPYPMCFFFKCILSLETYLNSNYDDLAKKRAIPGRIFLIAIYIPTVPSAERHGRNAAQQPL